MNHHAHIVPVEKIVTPEELANTQHLILIVQGMSCPNCALRVRNGLYSLKGVTQVEVSHLTSTADIFFNPDMLTINRLFETVANTEHDEHRTYKVVAVLTPASS